MLRREPKINEEQRQQQEQMLSIVIPHLNPIPSQKKNDSLITMHISACVGVATLKEFVSMQYQRTCSARLLNEHSTPWNRPLGSPGLDGCEPLRIRLTSVLVEFLDILCPARQYHTHTLPARNTEARRCRESPVLDAPGPGSRFPRNLR